MRPLPRSGAWEETNEYTTSGHASRRSYSPIREDQENISGSIDDMRHLIIKHPNGKTMAIGNLPDSDLHGDLTPSARVHRVHRGSMHS